MKQFLKIIWIVKLLLIWGAIAIVGPPGVLIAGEPDSAAWVSKIVSLQGEVLVRRHGQNRWQPARLNDIFFAGDRIRVESNSRAGIVLSNDAVMRLDQNTTLIFTEIEQRKTFIFRLIEGAANFFSHRPRSLKILTPFVNGVVEGTEFFVQVDATQTRIDLFEGRILAENDHGILDLAKGEGTVAQAGKAPQRYILVRPRESVQWAMYYPPVVALGLGVDSADINSSLALFNEGKTAEALAKLASIDPEGRNATFFVCRAAMLLHVGRIEQALPDIQQAQALDPQNGDALALKAIVAVVQNRPTEAVDIARQALQHEPRSASAHIALSYALQARFKLSDALVAAQAAVAKAPGSGLAWARLADLQLSVGALDKGVIAARKAVERAPQTAHAHTILGFAHLTRIETEKAREAFNQSIVLDSAAPLPRLGLGLANIRDGDLEKGRSEIEIAAGLDPGNSLIRSYLGKAYFDEKRDPLDGEQFEIAKALDPNDPTPWFYDAIRKQSLNRPVEALRDLQKSIELNDNRAVYRSRLMLDQDQAARGVSLARIYDDLSFNQVALAEASTSLNVDPTNHSAHRFLSDAYYNLPRHEIARKSELLQAQLLQPINVNPVLPQSNLANANISTSSGLYGLAFNEYTPLFEYDRPHLTASGMIGNNDTWGDEIVLSGLYRRLSYSLGQFHYQTDGFRENNDLENDTFDVFAQVAVTPTINLQTEFRQRGTEHGDLDINVDPNWDSRWDNDQDDIRVGATFSLSPSSKAVFSIIYSDRQSELHETENIGFLPTTRNLFKDEGGYQAEVQYFFTTHLFNFTAGLGTYRTDVELTYEIAGGFTDEVLKKSDYIREHDNVYIYTHLRLPDRFKWTLGISYDNYHGSDLDLDEISPKLGLHWDVTDFIRLRAAAFETVKRALTVEQTIEPTQISGFNQFFDDINGTETKQVGIGLDLRVTDFLYAGVEASQRDLRVPTETPLSPEDSVTIEDQKEEDYKLYTYWLLGDDWSVTAECEFEKIWEEDNDSADDTTVDTIRLPVSVRYFSPSGFFSDLTATYVDQDVERPEELNVQNDNFFVVDAALGYRLPKRIGTISFEVRNLFDEEFSYQDLNFHMSEPKYPQFVPDRIILFRVNLKF